jgi:hypothetical protein
VLCFIVFKEKNIFRYQLFNSDDVVMTRGNGNFHLCIFVKSGSLQCRILHGHVALYMKINNDF